MDYTIGQKFIFIYLLTYLLDLRPEKTKICLGTLWFEKKFISGGCLSCLASLECGEHRVITQSLVVSPKWKLFTMVGPVRLRIRDRILGRGVVKIHICVDIIFKWTGGSVHCLKYSQIVIIIKKCTVYTNMNFYQPLSPLRIDALAQPWWKVLQKGKTNKLCSSKWYNSIYIYIYIYI